MRFILLRDELRDLRVFLDGFDQQNLLPIDNHAVGAVRFAAALDEHVGDLFGVRILARLDVENVPQHRIVGAETVDASEKKLAIHQCNGVIGRRKFRQFVTAYVLIGDYAKRCGDNERRKCGNPPDQFLHFGLHEGRGKKKRRVSVARKRSRFRLAKTLYGAAGNHDASLRGPRTSLMRTVPPAERTMSNPEEASFVLTRDEYLAPLGRNPRAAVKTAAVAGTVGPVLRPACCGFGDLT